MSNPGDLSRSPLDRSDRDVESGCAPSNYPVGCASGIRSIYFPTAEATIDAAFDLHSRSYREPDSLFEVPADQYQEIVRRIEGYADGPGLESSLDAPDGTRFLKPGSISYRQALQIARSGRVDGVGFDAETQAVHCDFPYGLSFAAEHASARWAGGSERAAVAMALHASLKSGPNAAVYGLLSTRLAPTQRVAMKSTRTSGALSGVAGSPLGHGATEGTLRTLSSVTSSAATGRLGLLAGAGPVASTVAIGVVNMDFYRAALERSISWSQFTKNTVIKTTGIAAGTSGWAGGAVLGSALGGPLCALVGGVAGALSAGGLGAVGAKRVADRLVEDDATRLMAVVRRQSERLAFEYLLTASEIDRFAGRIKGLVDEAWLRRMFRSGRSATKSADRKVIRASRHFANRELNKICRAIVERRAPIVLPRSTAVNRLLEEIGLLETYARHQAPDPPRAGAQSRLRELRPGATL